MHDAYTVRRRGIFVAMVIAEARKMSAGGRRQLMERGSLTDVTEADRPTEGEAVAFNSVATNDGKHISESDLITNNGDNILGRETSKEKRNKGKDSSKNRSRVKFGTEDNHEETLDDAEMDENIRCGDIQIIKEKNTPIIPTTGVLPWEEDLQMLSAFSDKKVSCNKSCCIKLAYTCFFHAGGADWLTF